MFSFRLLFLPSLATRIYFLISAFLFTLIRCFALQSAPPVSVQVLLGQATSCQRLRLSSHDVGYGRMIQVWRPSKVRETDGT
jgi:hypothetical protein